MALSTTKICNLALSDLGANRINDFDDTKETGTEVILCRLHYEPIRDALLRSHYWAFASDRVKLAQDADKDPPFEWDNQFILPNDFLYLKSIYDGTLVRTARGSHALEGKRFLTNDSTVEIRYIKKVTDVTEFDPLFVQLLVLELDLKLVMPLTQDVNLKESIKDDIKRFMPSVRALSRQEANLIGRAAQDTWVDVRATSGGRVDSRVGKT